MLCCIATMTEDNDCRSEHRQVVLTDQGGTRAKFQASAFWLAVAVLDLPSALAVPYNSPFLPQSPYKPMKLKTNWFWLGGMKTFNRWLV
jgi:hypothetical protein